MIDLFKPDVEALRKKWLHIIIKTQDTWTWTSYNELCWLCEYVQGKERILEIGSHSGRSAKCMLLANPSLNILSLDTWDDEGSFESYEQVLRPEFAEGRVQWIKGASQESLKRIDPKTTSFDACFVDGGHEDHLVVADINGVIPLMKKGSLMAGHDFRGDNDVARGVRSVLGDNFQNPLESLWVHQL